MERMIRMRRVRRIRRVRMRSRRGRTYDDPAPTKISSMDEEDESGSSWMGDHHENQEDNDCDDDGCITVRTTMIMKQNKKMQK